MNAPQTLRAWLRNTQIRESDRQEPFLWGPSGSIGLPRLAHGTCLGGRARALAGRSVLVAAADPFAAALALIELDGVARRLILCTPDLGSTHRRGVIEKAAVDAVVSDDDQDEDGVGLRIRVSAHVTDAVDPPGASRDTEWVLLTSGTTSGPKLVVHTLSSLTAAIRRAPAGAPDVVWGTFYDIRRYGGLQIFLRAVLGRHSLVVSGAREAAGRYLARLAERRVTHVSGTPSHWRRALMSPEARTIEPRYIRLSGEIADQPILNALRSFYPKARVAHAFASTEAGVGFEVDDGLEGFPASLVSASGDVAIDVNDGLLRLRSARTAIAYLGEDRTGLADADGFVDTGDVVERRGDRYYFLGRRNGTINVGGLKVYPEEIEAAINRHPAVRMSRVRGRASPITGSLVTADVVLHAPPGPDEDASFKREILQVCREQLAGHKVPATIRFVPSLDLAAAGKLARHA